MVTRTTVSWLLIIFGIDFGLNKGSAPAVARYADFGNNRVSIPGKKTRHAARWPGGWCFLTRVIRAPDSDAARIREICHDMRQALGGVFALAGAALAEPGLAEGTRARLERIVGQAEWLGKPGHHRPAAPPPASRGPPLAPPQPAHPGGHGRAGAH